MPKFSYVDQLCTRSIVYYNESRLLITSLLLAIENSFYIQEVGSQQGRNCTDGKLKANLYQIKLLLRCKASFIMD